MISKAKLIDSIQQINRSANRDWLDLFDVSDLRHYLDHLQQTLEPRGAGSVWLRPSESSAVVTRRPLG